MRDAMDATPLGEITFGAFDLETTGLDPVKDRIVEIAAVVFRRGEIRETLQHLVDPGIPMPPEALSVHGITDAMLAGRPALPEVFPRIAAVLSAAVPVAHNAPFDLSFLLAAAQRLNLPFSPGLAVDTCQMARQAYPRSRHSLESLSKEFNLGGETFHRALADAKNCMGLFCKAVEALPLRWEAPWSDFQAKFSGILSLDFGRIPLPGNLSAFGPVLRERRRIVLSYKDGAGQVTKREVTPISLTEDDRRRAVMVGYCHLRQGTRTFRLDRILEMALVE